MPLLDTLTLCKVHYGGRILPAKCSCKSPNRSVRLTPIALLQFTGELPIKLRSHPTSYVSPIHSLVIFFVMRDSNYCIC